MTQSSTPQIPLCAKIDVSGLKSLTSLTIIDHKGLAELNASGCTALTVLNCFNAILTTLDVNGCTALTSLNCYNNLLTTLNVSSCTALTEILCYNNKLTALVVSSCTALTSLTCNTNLFTTLNASNLPVLQFLDVSEPSFGNNEQNTTLTSLNCSNSPLLTSLRIGNCSALTTINCTNNGLDELDGNGDANFDLWDRGSMTTGTLTVTGSPVTVNPNLTNLQQVWFLYNWNFIV